MSDRFPLPLDPPGIVRPAEDIATRTRRAKKALASIDKARLKSSEYARDAGEELKVIRKDLLPQKQWHKHLKENRIGEMKAGRCILICDHWGRIPIIVRGKGVVACLMWIKKHPQEYVTLDAWEAADEDQRQKWLTTQGNATFNPQGESESIHWALSSWNPITGCFHNCPYCYARDIANRLFEPKFAPTLWPSRLSAPANTSFPTEKIAEEKDAWRKRGLGNVFVGSMADMFGRWVPSEWIEAVLASCRAAPQWNFLFLTKFPVRMAEFEFPDNAWIGTTVDCQARVANAERSFRKVKAKVKWLSIEPLIEPLKFKDIGAFHWIVLGGASRSSQTPEWHPPFKWISDIREAATKAGVPTYLKTNILVRQYPGDKPIPEVTEAPAELHYLPTVETP